jgi:hypothetical protein
MTVDFLVNIDCSAADFHSRDDGANSASPPNFADSVEPGYGRYAYGMDEV